MNPRQCSLVDDCYFLFQLFRIGRRFPWVRRWEMFIHSSAHKRQIIIEEVGIDSRFTFHEEKREHETRMENFEPHFLLFPVSLYRSTHFHACRREGEKSRQNHDLERGHSTWTWQGEWKMWKCKILRSFFRLFTKLFPWTFSRVEFLSLI